MKKFLFMLIICLLYTPVRAQAQTCGENCISTPSCASLGYKQQIYCPDDYIICPFDSSYKWCKEYTCADGRYDDFPTSKTNGSCKAVSYHGLTCYDCSGN